MKQTNNKYLIIGGAPKCGTTSLFRYLSDHPDICPSHKKETYFFARNFDYNNVCLSGETLEDFEDYFSHCQSDTKIRLEATPYTLYAKNSSENISALLQEVYVLFILRNPIDRLISDYNFHTQRGHTSTKGSIQEFLDWQTYMKGENPNLIDQGCYIRYMHKFINTLGKDRVIILFFENLIANPFVELQRLCSLLGIDGSFYSNYSFKIHNPTISYRFSMLNRLYMGIEPVVSDVRSFLMHRPKLYSLFEQILDSGKFMYRLLNNRKPVKQESFSPENLQDLAMYYKPYNELLGDVIGIPVPWKTIEKH